MAKQPKSFLPAKASPKVTPWLWANDAWQDAFPAVFELLAAGIYEGEPRKPATLTIFVSEGRLKCCIRDRQSRQNCWMTLEGEINVLQEIERLLVAEKADWRPDKKGDSIEGVL